MLISNKYLSQIFNGTLEGGNNYIKGRHKGYYIVINTSPVAAGALRLTVCAHSDEDPGNARLADYLRTVVSNTKNILSSGVEIYYCWLDIKASSHKVFAEVCNSEVERQLFHSFHDVCRQSAPPLFPVFRVQFI